MAPYSEKNLPVPIKFLIQLNTPGTPTNSFLRWIKTSYQGYRRSDLYKREPAWEKMASMFGALLPVTLTIVHRPLRSPLKSRAEGRDEQEYLARLVDIAGNFSPNIQVEERPAAQLALASGDNILAPNSGTLGGIFDDPKGKSYGVTCAHVATCGHGPLIVPASSSEPVSPKFHVSLAGGTVCDPVILAMPKTYPGNGPDVTVR